jgi:benzodiazapine receptor
MMTNFVLRWLNVTALFTVLLYNWLANARPLNDMTTGEISALFPVQITPAPYAFSIWGMIYVLLIGFVVVQFMPSKRNQEEVKRVGPWFVVSCLFNVSWIVLWHYLYTGPSVVVMIGLLLSLIYIYSSTRLDGWSSDNVIRWLVQVPFSMYLGWITVATIVNISAALYAVRWGGFDFSGMLWTLLMILIASVISMWVGTAFRDPAYVGVTVWALIAVGVANSYNSTIMFTAWAAAGLLFLLALWLMFGESSRYRNKGYAKA